MRCSEKCRDEYDQVDSQESKLRPEVNNAEEREVDSDAIDESANNTWSAHILGDRIGGKLRAFADSILMVCAIWLLARVLGWTIAVCLWSPGCILWCDHHSYGVVDGQNH